VEKPFACCCVDISVRVEAHILGECDIIVGKWKIICGVEGAVVQAEEKVEVLRQPHCGVVEPQQQEYMVTASWTQSLAPLPTFTPQHNNKKNHLRTVAAFVVHFYGFILEWVPCTRMCQVLECQDAKEF